MFGFTQSNNGARKGTITRGGSAALDESYRGPEVFRRQARPNVPEAAPESQENIEQLCWGTEISNTQSRTGWSIQLQSISNTTQPENAGNVTKTYEEVSRVTSVIRVENPNDSFQYVDVERIEEITFRGEDGNDYKFILDHS